MYARSGKPPVTLPPVGGQPSQPYQDTRYQQPRPPPPPPSRFARPVAEAMELNERLDRHRVEPPRLSDYVFRASPYASVDAPPQATQEPDLDAIPAVPAIPAIFEQAELVNKLAQIQMKDGFQTLAYTPYPDHADATPLISKGDVPLAPPRGAPRYSPQEEVLFQPEHYGPFDAPGALSGLAPPVPFVPMSTPGQNPQNIFPPPSAPKGAPKTTDETTVSETQDPSHYDTTKPTCSLNLVCYRSGAKGCDLQQMQCVLQTMFPSEEAFQAAITANKDLVHSDDQFFREMQRLYRYKMCSFFRRYFSLKSLRAFRVLAYTPTTRPTVVPFDDFVLQEMMYAYQNPDRLSSSQDWIQWVFRLRLKDRRHALEFVEGWNTTRIAISGAVPCISSCLVGIIWTAMGGDVQSAFTVASFLLTISSIILALLAIISSIESSSGLSTSRY